VRWPAFQLVRFGSTKSKSASLIQYGATLGKWFGRDAVAWLLRSRRLLLQGHKSAEAFEAALAATPGALRGQWPMSPSCLLLDLRMNGMSGLIVARRERAHRLHGLRELSEREQDVMKLVAQGMSNKLIADTLNISARTVEVHLARVFDKLEVASAVELANLLNAARA
jgi:FixJ family two-component response regulator